MTDNAREAARLATMAHRFTYGDGGDAAVGAALAAEAQVYATLALADAQTPRQGVNPEEHTAVVADLAALRKVVARFIWNGLTGSDPAVSGAVRGLQDAIVEADLHLGGELDRLANAEGGVR